MFCASCIKITSKDSDSDYVLETGRKCNIRLNEHRKSYSKGDLSSELIIHSLETDHKPDFDNSQNLALNCTYYNC